MEFVKKVMIITTTIICSLMIIYLFGFPHPEQVKAWQGAMAMEDCPHLATYLIGAKNTPNYTKIASDNVQFVYHIYQQKNCTNTLGWSP